VPRLRPRATFVATDRVLREAAGSAFTGAVGRIECNGKLLFEMAYGVTRDDELAKPVYRDTLFDLASLTKLFVATCALEAVSDERISLDETLTGWLTEWGGTGHEVITLRMLLAHISGMDSGADYRELLGDNVVHHALHWPLVTEPGERVIYSDLGFIALGQLLQRIYGRALDGIVASSFERVVYRPHTDYWERIPATEDDGWRGRVQGQVHDEKAYLMGGIAGHAGLFGTARDVAAMAERYLGPLHGRTSMLPSGIVKEAIREQADDPILRRGLGWALKTSDDNSCGRSFSRSSFGHTGFVGTCIWADPERDLNAVLLTNSVYFGRTDTRDLRAAFYEAAVEDLDLK